MKYYGTRPHLNGILTLLSVGTNQIGILILFLQSIQNSPPQAERLRGHAMKLLATCRAALQTLGAVRQSHGIQQEMSRIAQSAAHRLRLVRVLRLAQALRLVRVLLLALVLRLVRVRRLFQTYACAVLII